LKDIPENKAEGESVKKKALPETPQCPQFQEEYTLMGFPSTCSDPPLALCFLCGEKLANSSMKQRPMFLTKLYSYDSICTLLIFIFTLPNRTFSQKLYVSVKGVILRYLRGGTIVPPRSEPLT
jgi:hypothetical protein